MRVDVLIIGQGIAGSMLAHFLMKEGKNVLLVDAMNPSSASRVAAGIFNPVSGRRITMSWRFPDFFSVAEETYMELEKCLERKFFHRKNIHRLLANKEEQAFWVLRNDQQETEYTKPLPEQNAKNGFENLHGGFETMRAGHLDIGHFLVSYRQQLLSKKIVLEESFSFDDLKIAEEKISWKNITAEEVIFCEGWKAIKNPWFNWVPFVPAKGEILTIKAPALSSANILMRGIFILPIGNDLFKVGATYNWDELNELPTEHAKKSLIDSLEKLIREVHSYKVPEMIGFPITWGHKPYLKWLDDSLR